MYILSSEPDSEALGFGVTSIMRLIFGSGELLYVSPGWYHACYPTVLFLAGLIIKMDDKQVGLMQIYIKVGISRMFYECY